MADLPKTQLKHIPLDQIHEPDEALRKVDRTTEKYVGLVESVRIRSVMCPITVREIIDDDLGETIFGLVDGLQRFSASKDTGKETIPCHVISCEDGELIEAQVMANVHKIETRPVEYSRALLKILQNNPLLTRADLANRLAKTGPWISERLGLLKLLPTIGELVDDDKVGLSNAYALAKLPIEEQKDFLDRARTMAPQQFTPTVTARVKELRDAKRKGRDATPEAFQPIAILRTRKQLAAEMDTSTVGPALCKEVKPKTPVDAFALAVRWALTLDPTSVEVQKAHYEERQAEKIRLKETSQLERKQKRATDAAAKAAKLKKEAEDFEKEEAAKAKAET